MTLCETIAVDAVGISALAPNDPERVAAEEHAVACERCARALKEAAHLLSLLSAVEPEAPPSAEALERASSTIITDLDASASQGGVRTVAERGARPRAEMEPGEQLSDRFVIERFAGAGGMGAIFRARDLVSGGAAAVKVIAAPRSSSRSIADRFAREAELLARLNHPGIVSYLDHGTTRSGRPYIAMEWLDGETLAERLSHGRLSIDESLTLTLRVAESLGHAHRLGVVHRDIKPSNLFLPDRRIDAVKVLDFGIARGPRLAPEITATGALLGTPGYVAPEQARGAKVVDARADVFSLGCVLFKCLTGRSAFVGEDAMAVLLKIVLEDAPHLAEHAPHAPRELEDLLGRMLAKSPAARPADGDAVAREIESLLSARDASEHVGENTPPSITSDEHRLLSIIAVSGAGRVESEVDSDAPTGHGPELERDRLRALLMPFDAEVEWLADGSLVATLKGATNAADQAARAARAALSLSRALPDAPIALVTGRGQITGSLPVGEIIDRAARMLRRRRDRGALGQGARPPVAVDELTAGLLVGFDVTPNGSALELKGELGPAVITRTLLGKPTRCVGRDRELVTLEAVLAECIGDGVARAVLVTAPAGVGKSRVRHEFADRIAATRPEVEVWLGRGDPMSAGSPFGLIAQVVRRAIGLSGGDSLEARRQKIRARVARRFAGRDLARVAEFLGELVGTPFASPGAEDASIELRAARRDAQLMGDQLSRAFEDWLSAECTASPIVLVLEDLHWGDLPTVRYIDSALRALERPLMVLALARPEVHSLFPDLWTERALVEIRLAELSRKPSIELVREVFGDALSDADVADLVTRSGGNAFYLEELIRAVAAGVRDRLPDTVVAMVAARLEALDPDSRRLLRAASVFGNVFWSGGVAALVGSKDVGSIDAVLADLAAREVISRSASSQVPDQREYAFRHAFAREGAYAMLTDEDRALGHALAGDWLEGAGAADARGLAEHFERGGKPDRAIGWYLRAAEQATEGNDLGAAIACADRAVACGAKDEELGRVRLLQASAHHWRGEAVETEERAVEALRLLAEGSADWLVAMTELLGANSILGRKAPLRDLIERLLRLEPRDETVSSYAAALARASLSSVLTLDALDVDARLVARLEMVAEVAERDPAAAAWVNRARASRAIFTGEPARFREISQRAISAADRAGDLRLACGLQVNGTYAFILLGDFALAERHSRTWIQRAERMGLRHIACVGRQHLACALAFQSEIGEARKVIGEVVDLIARGGAAGARLDAGTRIYVARIELLAGDFAAAERAARRALEPLDRVPAMRGPCLATLAQSLRESDPAAALSAAREAMDLFEASPERCEDRALIQLVYAECLEANGRGDEARRTIRAANRSLGDRASRIQNLDWRSSFLERVPENRRTLELAKLWLAGDPDTR